MRRICVAIALAMSVSACASVVRGTSELVHFQSNPPGATVTTNRQYSCAATPCSIQIDRSEQFDATFSLAGHQPQTIQVRTQLQAGGVAGMAGNVLIGGIIGVGVDAATGATLDHLPNPVVANLRPLAGGKARRSVRKRRGAGA